MGNVLPRLTKTDLRGMNQRYISFNIVKSLLEFDEIKRKQKKLHKMENKTIGEFLSGLLLLAGFALQIIGI